MRSRTLKAMNNLNTILTIYLGFVGILTENINKKLLTIKIIEASKTLRNKVIVWISKMSKGIRETLSYCYTKLKE